MESKELIWEKNNLRIRISHRNGMVKYLDVIASLNPDRAFGQSRTFKMLTTINDSASQPGLKFEDLQGNGYFSGYQRQGVGHMLTNCVIQYARRILPGNTKITGGMSSEGDPDDPDLKQNCQIGRNKFWESIGLTILPGELGEQKLTGTLSELKLINGPLLEGFERLIPIDHFQTL